MPDYKPYVPTAEDLDQARRLLEQITPIDGEVCCVYRCRSCGKLYGRRYIPYALGKGATFDPCLCQITSRNVPTDKILDSHDLPDDGSVPDLVEVRVRFDGVVRVVVPSNVPSSRRRPLAEKRALSAILAQVTDPGVNEEPYRDMYAKDFELPEEIADREWESTQLHDAHAVAIPGRWQIIPGAPA